MKCLKMLSLFLLGALSAAAAADHLHENAQALLSAGQADQAIQTLQKEIHGTPTAQSYNLLCRTYFALDDWDSGIPACERAVSLEPSNGIYHLWLGRIYGEKAARSNFLAAIGMAKKVRAEFERAVELSPQSWEARSDLAEFYLEAPAIVGGGKDKARAQAELLVPLNPAMAHWVKGRLAEKNKDNAAAEREYRAAIEASHDGAQAWLNLALFYRHTGRLDEMEVALRTMATRPTVGSADRNDDRNDDGNAARPDALVDGAGMLYKTGRDSALAMQLLRRYLSSPNMVEAAPAFKAHYLLGALLEKQGERQGAADEYRASLALAHDFGRAQEGLERVTR